MHSLDTTDHHKKTVVQEKSLWNTKLLQTICINLNSVVYFSSVLVRGLNLPCGNLCLLWAISCSFRHVNYHAAVLRRLLAGQLFDIKMVRWGTSIYFLLPYFLQSKRSNTERKRTMIMHISTIAGTEYWSSIGWCKVKFEGRGGTSTLRYCTRASRFKGSKVMVCVASSCSRSRYEPVLDGPI